MSLVLLVFDAGPLRPLAGKRGSVFFNEVEIEVKRGGATLATRALAVCHNWSSSPFQLSFDPALHRDLLRLLAGRLEAGKVPHLVFHWFEDNESTLEATGSADASIRDAHHLYETLHGVPNDTVVRITGVVDPMRVTVPALIAERLAEGDLPNFDGILFGDGAIVPMEHRIDVVSSGTETSVRPLLRSTLESYLAYNQNRWVSISPLASSRCEPEGISLTAGEGSVETDGFVVVRGLEDGSLRWAAYFQRSGPFKDVMLEEGSVVAISASGERYRFPLDQPELVEIEAAASRSG